MSELDLLAGVPTFLKLTERFKSSKNPRAFTQLFMSGGVEQMDGDDAIYELLINDRKLAAPRGRRADGFRRDAPNDKYIEQGLIHAKETEVIYPDELFLKAAAGTPMKSNANIVIARAAARIWNRLMLFREYVCARYLQDAAGVALNSSNTDFDTGAVTQAQNVVMRGGLVTQAAGAAWSTPATLMLSGNNQLPQFLNTIEANGYEGVRLIINRNTAKSVAGNLEAQTWLTNNGNVTVNHIKNFSNALGDPQSRMGRDPFERNVLSGLGGIPDWNVWHHGHETRTGAFKTFMDNDKAILLPSFDSADGESPIGFAEGPSIIPDPRIAIGNGEQAQELFSKQRGIVIWAYREVGDAAPLVIVGEDHFLPLVKDNNSILSITGL